MSKYDWKAAPTKPMKRDGGEVTERAEGDAKYLGYLGFPDRISFAIFATSPTFIPIFQKFRAAQPRWKPKSKLVLEGIEWLHDHLGPEGKRDPKKCEFIGPDGLVDRNKSIIPATLDEAWDMYGSSPDTGKELLGCLVYIADEILQREVNSDEDLAEEEISELYSTLENESHIKVSEENRNKWIGNDRVLPLGLRLDCMKRYKEDHCERWIRIWHSLHRLNYYRSETKQRGLFGAIKLGKDQLIAPKWWTASADEEEYLDPQVLLANCFASEGSPTIMAIATCTITLESDDDVDEYLSQLPEENLQSVMNIKKPLNICSPCQLPDLQQWISLVGKRLDFQNLEVNIRRLEMFLRDEHGNDLGRMVIFDAETSMGINEINDAIEQSSANSVNISFGVETGQAPDEPEYTVPTHLQQYLTAEDDGFVPTRQDDNDVSANEVPAQSHEDSSHMQACTEESTLKEQTADESATVQQPLEIQSSEKVLEILPTAAEPQDISNLDDYTWNGYRPSDLSAENSNPAGIQDDHVRKRAAVANIGDAVAEWQAITSEAEKGGYLPALTPELGRRLTLQVLHHSDPPDSDVQERLMHVTERWRKSNTRTEGKTHANDVKGDMAHLDAVAGTKLNRNVFDPFNTNLKKALKACRREAALFAYENPKPKDMKGLSQAISPEDVWRRDRAGPDGTRRERAKFIEEEYDGIDVFSSKTKLVEWQRKAIMKAAPGALATRRTETERTRKSQMYKDVEQAERFVNNANADEAMHVDREMMEKIQGMPTEGEDLENVSHAVLSSAALHILTYNRRLSNHLAMTGIRVSNKQSWAAPLRLVQKSTLVLSF